MVEGALSRAVTGAVIDAITMAARPIAIAFAMTIAIAGCDEPLAPPPEPAIEAPLASPAPPPRRPTRRYYLARTSERCEIFSEDGGDRTEPFGTPCPEYLRIGERIRIVGKTCFVENTAAPEREKPVVCPDPLTHFEKDLRAAGQ
jgi:hypothetical protein